MVMYDNEYKSRREFSVDDLLNHLSFARNNFCKSWETLQS